jgi:hypothetical protein
MPLQATSGAASYDAFGGGVPAVPNYIEDVFSSSLWTGNKATQSTTQTITNGVDLSTNGGLVWTKRRTLEDHFLFSTGLQTTTYALRTNDRGTSSERGSIANGNSSNAMTFNTDGFTVGGFDDVNNNTSPFVGWVFRKKKKFFDIVTWTGDGATSRAIAHNLGSIPGFIIVKRFTGNVSDWACVHNRNGGTYFALNRDYAANDALVMDSGYPDITPPSGSNTEYFGIYSNTSTVTNVNVSGSSYIAYVFAHNAGGFGLTGTDNVISCGSYIGNGSSDGPVVTLGYEPQWVMIKNSGGTGDWLMFDDMRGITPAGRDDKVLFSNTNGAEFDDSAIALSATGFKITGATSQVNTSTSAYIYMAVRKGPMKVPTSGASVFAINTRNGSGTAPPMYNSGFPIDMAFQREVTTANDSILSSRLTTGTFMRTSTKAAEASSASYDFDYQNGWFNGTETNANAYSWMFKRAPSFMDVVLYSGTGVAGRTVTHNLGVAPQLLITKGRNTSTTYGDWMVLPPTLQAVKLNEDTSQDDSSVTAYYFGNGTSVIAPTSTVFTLGGENTVNQSGLNFVAYLFATCAGVSKVGSYTGTATTKQIDCGFTSGARFVLLKRVDGVGAWYVWDSARGIVSGNDPYILLNSSATQVTNTDYIDTYSAGFEISSTAPDAINASGGTFIFLAIA